MSESKNISYKPTDGLSYNPNEDAYWDPKLLDKEIQRAFEICHGCRMCFKYCDSFPFLFGLLDERYDGDVRRLMPSDVDQVMQQCFQCKLCEVQCPYTPRDGHEFQLDFPKLVHRYQAVKVRRHGVSFRDSVLGNPDRAASFARMSFGLANAMNKVSVHRLVMEKTLGIHREKILPPFASQTFEAWAEKAGRTSEDPRHEAVLFPTCYVQNNEPNIGRDTLQVMDKNQVDIVCRKGLVCCGMPAWEHGDLEALRKNARINLDLLTPFTESGAKIVVINPTCSMMIRREYPELVPTSDKARAEKVASATMDAGEFLWSIRDQARFNTDFKSTPGASVAYHAPCHLRAQAVGFKGRDLLRKIPGVSPKSVLECCGHDGTYGMKVETFEASKRVGERAFEALRNHDSEVWATECPLAATQFEQHAQKRALHPMTILARAYEADGFPTPIDLNDEDEENA